jgi:hypothetical protein
LVILLQGSVILCDSLLENMDESIDEASSITIRAYFIVEVKMPYLGSGLREVFGNYPVICVLLIKVLLSCLLGVEIITGLDSSTSWC